MKMTIDAQDKRITKLEVDLQRVINAAYTERSRTTAGLPPPYALRHTTSPSFGRGRSESEGGPSAANDDAVFISCNSVIRSSNSIVGGRTTTMRDMRPSNPAVSSMSTPSVFKSNSAISNKSYYNKASIWGTVFASPLVSCTRTYIQKSGDIEHMIDEKSIMKTCVGVVGDLYTRSSFREPPQVQSNEVTILSSMFSRKNKNEVPMSSVSTWTSMMNHTDGAPCISIIEHIMKSAKMVPEALTHPISRIVATICQLVVVTIVEGPKYATERHQGRDGPQRLREVLHIPEEKRAEGLCQAEARWSSRGRRRV